MLDLFSGACILLSKMTWYDCQPNLCLVIFSVFQGGLRWRLSTNLNLSCYVTWATDHYYYHHHHHCYHHHHQFLRSFDLNHLYLRLSFPITRPTASACLRNYYSISLLRTHYPLSKCHACPKQKNFLFCNLTLLAKLSLSCSQWILIWALGGPPPFAKLFWAQCLRKKPTK